MSAFRRLGLAVCGLLLLASAPVPYARANIDRQWVPRGILPYQTGSFGLAYDQARRVTLFFGREAGSTTPSTWTWDGSAWTPHETPLAPSPRGYFGMAYDGAVARTVLFGGYVDDEDGLGGLNDTWEWDGARWIERRPAARPPARWGGAMAYDALHRKLILFGGMYGWIDCCRALLADTWEWDGANWRARSPATSPPPRVGHSMAFDASTGTVVLFGGSGDGGLLNDMWTWDGATWTRRFPASGPSRRSESSIAYDATRRKVVLHGGIEARAYLDDTWEWNGVTWTPITAPITPGRRAMVFDSARRELILLGSFFEMPLCGEISCQLTGIVNGTQRSFATWALRG